MSVVEPADVRALVASALTDETLQAVIDREEAWLARRIGPLVGERTQTLWVRSGDGPGPRYLQRSTDAIVVADAGVELDETDVRLLANGGAIELVAGSWTGPVEVTYTPNDEAEVVSAIVELVALGMSPGALQSETIGQYSYTRQASPATRRNAIARSFLPRLGAGMIHLRPEGRTDRISTIGAVTSGVES